MENKGINYGSFNSNLDTETGIRYGVIHQNQVLQAWCDDSEPYYQEEIECSHCGDIVKYEDVEHCQSCNEDITMDIDMLEPISWRIEYSRFGYQAESDDYGDIFITKSPYFTYAQFCSPCAPGAVHLENPLAEPDENQRGYCFGHDWFEDEKAPYKVYEVETGKLV